MSHWALVIHRLTQKFQSEGKYSRCGGLRINQRLQHPAKAARETQRREGKEALTQGGREGSRTEPYTTDSQAKQLWTAEERGGTQMHGTRDRQREAGAGLPAAGVAA